MAGRTPHLAARRWDFIDDPMLQDILRRDYDELRRLVRRRADKSVVVLSGTIVEALLAGLLSKDKEAAIQALRRKSGNREPKPFAEWTLYPLIQAAVELKLLDGNAEIQASALKDFRNLIHPLVQERMLAVLNAGTVNTALALLVSVLDHLESQRTRAVKKGLEQWTVSRGLTPTWTATHGYLPKLYVNGEAFTLFLISSKHRLQIRFGRLRAVVHSSRSKPCASSCDSG